MQVRRFTAVLTDPIDALVSDSDLVIPALLTWGLNSFASLSKRVPSLCQPFPCGGTVWYIALCHGTPHQVSL
jgi:hypothetical protein